jgi:hypothetical protein
MKTKVAEEPILLQDQFPVTGGLPPYPESAVALTA